MGYPDWQAENTLAALIAGALSTAGIPVLGNPIPLYSIQAGTGTGTPALIGATVGGSAWDPNVSHATAMADFDTYVNGNPCTTASKSFWEGGTYPTAIPQSDQDLINAGAWIYLSVKPSLAFSTAEDNALKAFLTMYINAGAKLKVIIWHEPQNHFPTPTAWQGYFTHYAPVIRSLGLKVVYDSASHAGESGVLSWWPNTTPDEVLQDIYWSTYQNGVTWNSMITKAGQQGIPCGIGEWNIDSNSAKTPTTAQWNAFCQAMITDFTNAMVNGQNLNVIMYYMSSDAPAQPNNLLLSSTDWKVANWNAIQAALSVSPNFQGVSVNPGQTVTFAPLAPSPGGGFAVANGQSYDIATILTAGAGSTQPFGTFETAWLNDDIKGGVLLHPQRWQLPAGQSGSAGALTIGTGPQIAQYLRIKLTNRDTVAMLAQLYVNSVSRVVHSHDLRWDAVSSPVIPGYTLAGGTGYGLELGEGDTINLNPGQSKNFLLSMFAGQARIRCSALGAAGTQTVQFALQAQPVSRWGNTNTWSQFLPLGPNPNDRDQTFLAALPRGPMQLTITNNDANAVTVAYEVIAIET